MLEPLKFGDLCGRVDAKSLSWGTFLDKSKWPRGAWDDEPDRIEWRDPKTGMPCLMLRHTRNGIWCGYIALPADHPWIGQNIYRLSTDGTELTAEDSWEDPRALKIHGEITFGPAKCQPAYTPEERERLHDPAPDWHRVCHTVQPGESDDVRWIGFDCGHGGYHDPDLEPGNDSWDHDRATYRDVDYVINWCARLAAQAQQAAEAVAARQANADPENGPGKTPAVP